MHLTEDKVICLVNADLDGRVVEVFVVKALYDACRPLGRWHLLTEKLRRPPAEKHRAAPNAISQSRKSLWYVCPPWQTPHLRSRYSRIILYRWRCHDPNIRQVLGMLGEYKRTCFEHQNTVIPKLVAVEEVLRQGAAESAATNDKNIKGAGIR